MRQRRVSVRKHRAHLPKTHLAVPASVQMEVDLPRVGVARRATLSLPRSRHPSSWIPPYSPRRNGARICNSVLSSLHCPRNQFERRGCVKPPGQITPQCFPSPHDAGFHRPHRYFQNFGDLLVTHVLHFAQNQRRAKAGLIAASPSSSSSCASRFIVKSKGVRPYRSAAFRALGIVESVFDAGLARRCRNSQRRRLCDSFTAIR